MPEDLNLLGWLDESPPQAAATQQSGDFLSFLGDEERKAGMTERERYFFEKFGDKPKPKDLRSPAQRNIDNWDQWLRSTNMFRYIPFETGQAAAVGLTKAVYRAGSLYYGIMNDRDESRRMKEIADSIEAARNQIHGGGFWPEAVSMMSENLTKIAPLAPLGTAAIIGGISSQTVNDALNDADQAGIEGWNRPLYAIGQGAYEGAITGLFSAWGVGGTESVGSAFRTAGQQAFRQGFTTAMKNGIKAAPAHLAAEYTEEGLIMTLQSLAMKRYGVDPNAMDTDRLWHQSKLIGAVVPMIYGSTGTARASMEAFANSPTRENARKLPRAVQSTFKEIGQDFGNAESRNETAQLMREAFESQQEISIAQQDLEPVASLEELGDEQLATEVSHYGVKPLAGEDQKRQQIQEREAKIQEIASAHQIDPADLKDYAIANWSIEQKAAVPTRELAERLNVRDQMGLDEYLKSEEKTDEFRSVVKEWAQDNQIPYDPQTAYDSLLNEINGLNLAPLSETRVRNTAIMMEKVRSSLGPDEYNPPHRPESYSPSSDPRLAVLGVGELRSIEVPELMEIARQVAGGYPIVNKLLGPLTRGRARSYGFSPTDPAMIDINEAVAGDPVQLGRTLSHEIGHIDQFFHKDAIGGIPGKIAELKSFLAGQFKTGNNSFYRDELLYLSRWWRPYDPAQVSDAYNKYRESAAELHADAVSVLLVSPNDIATRAPAFFDLLVKTLDQNPKFLDSILEAQWIMSGERAEIARRRIQMAHSMYDRADDMLKAQKLQADEYRRNAKASFIDYVFQYLVDKIHPSKKIARSLGKKGVKSSQQAEQAFAILDDIHHPDRGIGQRLDIQESDIIRPIVEAGMSKVDLNDYLKARRIITERGEIGNPQGFNPDVESENLDELRRKVGPENFELLESKAIEWHRKVWLPLMEDSADAGTISNDTLKNVVYPGIDNYSAFVVVKMLQDGRVSSGVYRQYGTFSDILGPIEGSTFKMVAQQRFNNHNRVRRQVISDLLDWKASGGLKGEIEEVKFNPFTGKYSKDAPPGHTIEWAFFDGKRRNFIVPEYISHQFQTHNIGKAYEFSRAYQTRVGRAFHKLFVTYNPAFAVANIARDVPRTMLNLPAEVAIIRKNAMEDMMRNGASRADARKATRDIKVTWRDLLRNAVLRKAPWVNAWVKSRGGSNAVLDEMESEGTLEATYQVEESDFEKEVAEYDKLLARHGIEPAEAQRQAVSMIEGMLGGIRTLTGMEFARWMGEYTESWSKVWADQTLREAGIDPKQRTMVVKKSVGTPDWKQRGLATPFTNTFFMYSKVRVNQLTHDLSLAFNPKSAAGWWMRMSMMTFLPTAIIYGLHNGLFGDHPELEDAYDKIPSWMLWGYYSIPIGNDKDGNLKYMTIPMGDMPREMNRMTWTFLDWIRNEDPEGASEFFGSIAEFVIPYSMEPISDLLWKHKDYALGKNPYDDFRGRQVVPQSDWEAGGWTRYQHMLDYTAGKTGVLQGYVRVATSELAEDIQQRRTRGEAVMELAGLGRFIRTSKTTIGKEARNDMERYNQYRAQLRGSLDDNTRRLSGEHHTLMNLRLSGAKMTARQHQDLASTGFWYNKIYLPYTKAIKNLSDGAAYSEQQGNDDAAKAARAEADRIRGALSGLSEEFLKKMGRGR